MKTFPSIFSKGDCFAAVRASVIWAGANSDGQFVSATHAIATKRSFCRNQWQRDNSVTMSVLGLGFTGKYHSTITVSDQAWRNTNISVFYVDLVASVMENIKFHGVLVSQDSPPMAQSTFLVKSHMVLIAWRPSCKPPCHAASLNKGVLNYHETTWFDLWCCRQVWAWRKFQGELKKNNRSVYFSLQKNICHTFNNSLVRCGGVNLGRILQHYLH